MIHLILCILTCSMLKVVLSCCALVDKFTPLYGSKLLVALPVSQNGHVFNNLLQMQIQLLAC